MKYPAEFALKYERTLDSIRHEPQPLRAIKRGIQREFNFGNVWCDCSPVVSGGASQPRCQRRRHFDKRQQSGINYATQKTDQFCLH